MINIYTYIYAFRLISYPKPGDYNYRSTTLIAQASEFAALSNCSGACAIATPCNIVATLLIGGMHANMQQSNYEGNCYSNKPV